MVGLVPTIHDLLRAAKSVVRQKEVVDARDKHGHDD
jgi:hypothetical protein